MNPQNGGERFPSLPEPKQEIPSGSVLPLPEPDDLMDEDDGLGDEMDDPDGCCDSIAHTLPGASNPFQDAGP